jgi:hypothetical protein
MRSRRSRAKGEERGEKLHHRRRERGRLQKKRSRLTAERKEEG